MAPPPDPRIVQLARELEARHVFSMRRPPWIEPPHNAQPFAFGESVIVTGPGAGVASTTQTRVVWQAAAVVGTVNAPAANAFLEPGTSVANNPDDANEVQDVPRGWFAVIWPSVNVAQVPATDVAFNATRQARFSIRRNNELLPGLTRQMPGGTQSQLAAAAVSKSAFTVPSWFPMGLIFKPGDTCNVDLHLDDVAATVNCAFDVRVVGWFFPDDATDPYIRQLRGV